MQSVKNSGRKFAASRIKLNAKSLAGLGIGSIIGSGFFLGSAISIRQAGPSVVLAFLLCGFLFSQVLGAITSVSVNRPVTGCFKVYAEQFFGKYFGFLTGWGIFCSNILAIGSEAVAAGIFLRYWFPKTPLAPLSCLVVAVVITVNRLNTKDFGLVESVMAAVKILAVLFFAAEGFRFLAAGGAAAGAPLSSGLSSLFPTGVPGFLRCMLVVIFTYAGVSTVAMATSKVNNPKKDIPKATAVMTAGVILLYAVSTFLIVRIVGWNNVSTNISPMVQAFGRMGYEGVTSAVNAVIFVAALSVMIGSYFGSMQVLSSLAQAGEAPKAFSRAMPGGFLRNAWALTGALALLVAAVSFALSEKLFSYLVSASSFFTFYNWTINLLIYLRWRRLKSGSEDFTSPLILGKPGAAVTLAVLAVLAVSGLFVQDFRIGFYVAAAICLLISLAYLLWKRKKAGKSGGKGAG